jgi:hypothetical protein
MTDRLRELYHEQRTFQGLASNGNLVWVYGDVDPKSDRSWTMLFISPNNPSEACIFATGKDMILEEDLRPINTEEQI